MKRHHTFLFAVDRWSVIDGAPERGGGEASFINHCCEPNCESVTVGKTVFIEALRTIYPGEELSYDYQYDRDGSETAATERFYLCRCGADSCRGTMLKPRRPKRTSVHSSRTR